MSVRPTIVVTLALCLMIPLAASGHSHDAGSANGERRSAEPDPQAASLTQGYRHRYAVGGRLTLQNDWSPDHATASSIGLGFMGHVFAVQYGPVALGLEAGADFLFREGDMIIPVEIALKAFFETHTYAEPYLGLGPVVSIDFGGETRIHYGGTLSFGVALHSTRMFGFFVEGTYRWLGGHGFQQQLAFALGPFLCF